MLIDFRVFLRTIQVLLQRVGHQTAVVGTRRQQVRDPIIIIVVITLVPLSVFVCVQLRTVDDGRAVVPGVLVSVAITGDELKI